MKNGPLLSQRSLPHTTMQKGAIGLLKQGKHYESLEELRAAFEQAKRPVQITSSEKPKDSTGGMELAHEATSKC